MDDPTLPPIGSDNIDEFRDAFRKNLTPDEYDSYILGPDYVRYRTYAELKRVNPGVPAKQEIYEQSILGIDRSDKRTTNKVGTLARQRILNNIKKSKET